MTKIGILDRSCSFCGMSIEVWGGGSVDYIWGSPKGNNYNYYFVGEG
jgi:hypothetical protein